MMSLVLSTVGGMIGAALGIKLGTALGVTGVVLWVLAGGAAAVGLAVWTYSPLPDQIGFMAGDPNTGWGWSGSQEVQPDD